IMQARIWRLLRIEHLSLQINTLGTTESRMQYRADLRAWFQARFDQLDEDSRRRLERNPLRILDSKNPDMQGLIADAPRLTQYLDAESEAHFNGLRALLDDAGVPYVVNPRLVRGLDYYGRTVFEWVTDRLGTQGAVCAGGRYDGLVEHLGGEPTPAIGFAIGLERLVELYALAGLGAPHRVPDVYVVAVGQTATRAAFRIAEGLRDGAGLCVETNCGGGSFKSQMKRADRSGATVAVLLGEDEVAGGTAVVKALRAEVEQTTVPMAGLADAIAVHLRSRP
ncbi:MAG: histidine--tRNA ligase, partial [Gammaproteobacteria bacterium]|nr:histidine--tRNA ligase [Gammaproteobacteria bacterium]